jgi:hypothetical protein
MIGVVPNRVGNGAPRKGKGCPKGIEARRGLFLMKRSGLAAPYSVPVRENACSLRQTELLDPRHKLQSIAAFLAIAKAIVKIFARGYHKAALAVMLADLARASKLGGTPCEVQTEIARNFSDAHFSA